MVALSWSKNKFWDRIARGSECAASEVTAEHIYMPKTIDSLFSPKQPTQSQTQRNNANKMRLFLSIIVLLYILPIRLAMPSQLLHCSRPYDCTGRENNLLSHFSRVTSFFACAAKCQDESECEHFTYNMNRHGHYPGACYLFSSCFVQRPSNGQWVSSSKSCISPVTSLPRHLRDRASQDRLQLATRNQ